MTINRISYADLKVKYKNTSVIPYYELLLTNEWHTKREQIIIRDSHSCTNCGKQETEYFPGMGHTWLYSKERMDYISTLDGVELNSTPLIFHDISDKPYHLHVHHNYYVLSHLPWNYNNDALTTLCNWCHWEFHKKNSVPIYDTIEKLNELNYSPCIRCNGAGHFPEYDHVQNGICFRCDGLKYEELIQSKFI